jgi:hypothetical protein
MDGPTVVREVLCGVPSFLYTLDMQAEDFGGPVGTVDWYVAQMSTIYGAGIFAGLISGVEAYSTEWTGDGAGGAEIAGQFWQVS